MSLLVLATSACFELKLPSITEQQSQASSVDACNWAEESLTQAFVQVLRQCGLTKPGLPVSRHSDWISNSAILSDDYILLLSVLCTGIQVKKMALQMRP